jgi:hypothetical protein
MEFVVALVRFVVNFFISQVGAYIVDWIVQFL